MGKRQREAGRAKRQSPKETRRLVTALHEAGHAVAAVRLGIRVESVEVFQNTQYIEDSGNGSDGMTTFAATDDTDTQTLKNRIVVAMAGCEINGRVGVEGFQMDLKEFLAEASQCDLQDTKLFIKLLCMTPEDRKNALRPGVVTHGGPTPEAIEKHIRDAGNQLDLLLDAPTLEVIKRVATRLCKQGRMTGDEIQEELSVTRESDTVAVKEGEDT